MEQKEDFRQVNVRLRNDDYEYVRWLAYTERSTVSGVVRRLIRTSREAQQALAAVEPRGGR